MATPFISFLEPSKLEGFQAGVTHDAQPPSLPRLFLDAMEVRETVFVQEQAIALENEFDADDARACHWVAYATINETQQVEVPGEDGNVVQSRKTSTRTTPIGTIRLVPFPHEPHPIPGGRYWNGVLQGEPDGPSTTGTTNKAPVADRPTSLHDGSEPYVKLGRLAVVKEFRGNNVAGLLVNTALSWLKANPSYFDQNITEQGLEHGDVDAASDRGMPKWGGLICVHAQERVVSAWAKWGFRVDEGMGKWWEEDISHLGMFQRLQIDPKQVCI